MKDLKLQATLCPSFPHFLRFAGDQRLSGIRINSAQVDVFELDKELEIADSVKDMPFYFDIKGRQLRVVEAIESEDHLELVVNHPVSVPTPIPCFFKAGSDGAMLKEIVGGTRLVFDGGPKFRVKPGESLHIRHPKLKVGGPIFTKAEKEKIDKVFAAGFRKYYLSYVESSQEINELREVVGKDSEVVLKIESKAGLDFVSNKFVKKDDRTTLMAARGDLYIEIDKPHQILAAMRLIIDADPYAFCGSRMLLSLVTSSTPECCDFSELAWLYDIGYRTMLLCDEICLKESLLATAVNAFDAFRDCYAEDVSRSKTRPSVMATRASRLKHSPLLHEVVPGLYTFDDGESLR